MDYTSSGGLEADLREALLAPNTPDVTHRNLNYSHLDLETLLQEARTQNATDIRVLHSKPDQSRSRVETTTVNADYQQHRGPE